MKKTLIALTVLFTFAVTTPIHADGKGSEQGKHHKHAQGTVKLPHILKVVMKHKSELKITPEQEERIKKEVMQVYPPKIHPMMEEVKTLERTLRKSVLKDHKTAWDLTFDLQKLSKKKLALTQSQIEALNRVASILTKEQWAETLKLKKKMKQRKQRH